MEQYTKTGAASLSGDWEPHQRRVPEAPLHVAVQETPGTWQDQETHLARLERLAAVGELACGVVHDFNNALATILGHVQLLLMQAREPEAQHRLKSVERAVRDASAIVQRMRQFYHLQPTEPPVPLDVNALLEEVVQMTRPKWEHEAQVRCAPVHLEALLSEVAPVVGQAVELREVLTNLILNALWAMPAGGTLTLCTVMEGTWVRIDVTDTGLGMPPEVQERIFEPFFTTKGEQGTGLGLSVARRLIRDLGGDIGVESQEGYGTTFTLRLPAAPVGVPLEVVPSGAPEGCQTRLRSVEDPARLREVVPETRFRAGHGDGSPRGSGSPAIKARGASTGRAPR